MDDERHEVRATSFGGVADLYERARPGYPADAVKWLVGSAHRVVDLGAGTGKLTRQLVTLGCEVVAVEPSPGMLTQLRAASTPRVEALAGKAENIPLPAASVDAVIAAQAFHWFNQARALEEIARVMVQGGNVGLIWNIPDQREPWVARLSALAGGLPSEPQDPGPAIAACESFSAVEKAVFLHAQRLERHALIELAASWSQIATLAPDQRERRLTAIGNLFDQEAEAPTLTLPYVAYAYRAGRL